MKSLTYNHTTQRSGEIGLQWWSGGTGMHRPQRARLAADSGTQVRQAFGGVRQANKLTRVQEKSRPTGVSGGQLPPRAAVEMNTC